MPSAEPLHQKVALQQNLAKPVVLYVMSLSRFSSAACDM